VQVFVRFTFLKSATKKNDDKAGVGSIPRTESSLTYMVSSCWSDHQSCLMKPKILIVYHERLGDIARCLPLARHFAGEGYDVQFECRPEYHDLFSLVTYCTPTPPNIDRSYFEEVIDLQIWPTRFADFTARGLNWMDYIYEPWPTCDRQIVFDHLPKQSDVPEWVWSSILAFPSGYSQRNPPNPGWVIGMAHKLNPGRPVCILGKRDLGCYELASIPQLVAWLAAAHDVVTVNSAASILCSAVRESWHHVPDLDPIHDWQHLKQIVIARV
jgi:hypothetical protein